MGGNLARRGSTHPPRLSTSGPHITAQCTLPARPNSSPAASVLKRAPSELRGYRRRCRHRAVPFAIIQPAPGGVNTTKWQGAKVPKCQGAKVPRVQGCQGCAARCTWLVREREERMETVQCLGQEELVHHVEVP